MLQSFVDVTVQRTQTLPRALYMLCSNKHDPLRTVSWNYPRKLELIFLGHLAQWRATFQLTSNPDEAQMQSTRNSPLMMHD